MKIIVCVFNEGYSDITMGRVYAVVKELDNVYEIIDDSNEKWRYPKVLFEVIID